MVYVAFDQLEIPPTDTQRVTKRKQDTRKPGPRMSCPCIQTILISFVPELLTTPDFGRDSKSCRAQQIKLPGSGMPTVRGVVRVNFDPDSTLKCLDSPLFTIPTACGPLPYFFPLF
jgi:hypothetical protein